MKDNGLLLEIYFNQCMNVSFSKMKKLNLEYYPKTLYLNDYTYDAWYEELDDKTTKKKEIDDKTHTHTQTDEKINKRHSLVDTPPMLPLESEEVEFLWYRTNAATRRWWKSKKRKKVKTLNSKQTINHTPSIISTNKSWKSFKHTKKKKNRQILCLFYQHNKITKKLYKSF